MALPTICALVVFVLFVSAQANVLDSFAAPVIGLSADNQIFALGTTGQTKILGNLQSAFGGGVVVAIPNLFLTPDGCIGAVALVDSASQATQFCLNDGTFSWPYPPFPSGTWVNVTILGEADGVNVNIANVYPSSNYYAMTVDNVQIENGTVDRTVQGSDLFCFPLLYPSYNEIEFDFVANGCSPNGFYMESFVPFNPRTESLQTLYAALVPYATFGTSSGKVFVVAVNQTTQLFGIYLVKNGDNFLAPNDQLVVNLATGSRQASFGSASFIPSTGLVYVAFHNVVENFIVVANVGAGKVVNRFGDLDVQAVSLIAVS